MAVNRPFLVRAVYAAWLLWAWIKVIPIFIAGAAVVSIPFALLILFSALVIGLLLDNPIAWLLSPLPAGFIAFLGVPWFILNLGTSLGYDSYYDSPGLLTTLFVGVVLPGAALAVLVILGIEWRRVIRLFLRHGHAI